MRRLLCLSLLLPSRAAGRPTTSATKSSCTKDDLYSSMSRDGTEFCESVVDNHCASVSTPTQYTSYDSDEISSYCECILTEASSTQTDATSGGGLEHPTETSFYPLPGPSEDTSSHASGQSTATSPGSTFPAATSTGPPSSPTPMGSTSSSAQSSGSSASNASSAVSGSAEASTSPSTSLHDSSVTSSDTASSTGSSRTRSSTRSVTTAVTETAISSISSTASDSVPSSERSDASATPSGANTSSFPSASPSSGTSTRPPGSGSWNSTATGSTSTVGTTGTASAGLPGGSIVSSGSASKTGMSAESETSRSQNATGTSPISPSGTAETTSTDLITPSGSQASGPWNGTATASQTSNVTSSEAPPGGASRATSASSAPPESTRSPEPTSQQSGSWNSTVSGGTTSRGGIWSTGSLVSTRRSSTQGGLSVPWNSTATGVDSPTGTVSQGTGISVTVSIVPTRATPSTHSSNSTSGGAYTPSKGASRSLSLTTNATTPGSGSVVPTVPSNSFTSSFPGWNATLSTSAGLGTSVWSGTGTIGTGSSTAGANSTISSPTGNGPSKGTTASKSNSATANSTAISITPPPTSIQPGTGTAGTASSSPFGNYTFNPSTLRPITSGTAPPGSTVVGPETRTSTTNLASKSSTSVSWPLQTSVANVTDTAMPTPTLITPPGGDNTSSTSFPGSNTTAPSATPVRAANFTQVMQTAALEQEACYHLPQDAEGDTTHRALMRNSKLRETNVTVPIPYIESIEFESKGLQPLFMTVRDSSEGTYFLDISNKSRLAITDTSGNSMLLDDGGVRFATDSCRFDVNITISEMFAQLADLSDIHCPFGNSSVPKPGPIKRAEDIQFNQTLFLRDQCGSPVTPLIRDHPELRVGDTECTGLKADEVTGRWDFDCTFPGSYSGTLRCQKAVQDDIVDLLLKDSIGGECPDLSTVVSTLANASSDIINGDSLREALESRADGDVDEPSLEAVVDAYENLWVALKEFFVAAGETEANATAPWGEYLSVYNAHRSFEEDICEDLHAGEIPLSLNLRAGASYIDPITTLNWAPRSAPPYNITVQDPSAIACCPDGREAENQGEDACAYADSAFVGETGCVCGLAADGQSLAFEMTECGNFDETCETDGDCQGDGFVCLTGTCCGVGVCVDPYACSQNGTALVTFGGLQGPSR